MTSWEQSYRRRRRNWRRKGYRYALAYFALGLITALVSGHAYAFAALSLGLISGTFLGILALDELLEDLD